MRIQVLERERGKEVQNSQNSENSAGRERKGEGEKYKRPIQQRRFVEPILVSGTANIVPTEDEKAADKQRLLKLYEQGVLSDDEET